jgi:repressor LexA
VFWEDSLTTPITARQREALSFIGAFVLREHTPPTIREIGKHMGIRWTNGVNDHLLALQRKGLLEIGSRSKSRDFRVTGSGWLLLGYKRCDHCGSFVEPGRAA